MPEWDGLEADGNLLIIYIIEYLLLLIIYIFNYYYYIFIIINSVSTYLSILRAASMVNPSSWPTNLRDTVRETSRRCGTVTHGLGDPYPFNLYTYY